MQLCGDPTKHTFGNPNFTEEQRQLLIEQWGLNESLQVQYVKYLQNIYTWNFGFSFWTREPVAEGVLLRLPNTLLLLVPALIGSVLIGTAIGVIAGSKRGSKADVVSITAGMFTVGLPVFFVQIAFILCFSFLFKLWLGFELFPHRGMLSTPVPVDSLSYVVDVIWHMVMPVVTLTLMSLGGYALFARNLTVDAMTQDHVLTARAKGLDERSVMFRHVLRTALPPIITVVTMAIPGIIGGSMITEYLFTWPGIGSWFVNSLGNDDYPVVQAVLFLYAVLTVACNLAADLLYGILDPRVRVGAKR
jgi:peptide/nickel transport system permease protein